jgi:hypothetical protein
MDKRYFEEFIYLLSGRGEKQVLYWKMNDGIYNFFSIKILSN